MVLAMPGHGCERHRAPETSPPSTMLPWRCGNNMRGQAIWHETDKVSPKEALKIFRIFSFARTQTLETKMETLGFFHPLRHSSVQLFLWVEEETLGESVLTFSSKRTGTMPKKGLMAMPERISAPSSEGRGAMQIPPVSVEGKADWKRVGDFTYADWTVFSGWGPGQTMQMRWGKDLTGPCKSKELGFQW